MRYLCLIYLDGRMLEAMPEPEMSALNARHLALNDELSHAASSSRPRRCSLRRTPRACACATARSAVTDGPYAETKEMVAGFYFIEARDLNEAIQVAARIPSARWGRSRCGRAATWWSTARRARPPANPADSISRRQP
jgi:hypothetical protein